MTNKFKLHPWHGVEIGAEAPQLLTAFIEIIPSDTVKYEIDKESGYLKVDRPQKFSNVVPALYGFVPQTYCCANVAKLCMQVCSREHIIGDRDPLDILVLTEKQITHGDILVKAYPIGGLRLIDNQEVDDKIIAVLKDDQIYGSFKEISELPSDILNRLKHYFLTYKQMPDKIIDQKQTCEIVEVYGSESAYQVIKASQLDYQANFS